jgi:exopolysaccharide production protein ExoZ
MKNACREKMSQKIRSKLTTLQVGRAVAALMVLFFHLGGTINAEKYYGLNFVPQLGVFRFGDAGVEFFFVLSGFLITFIHYGDIGRREKIFSYLKKRLVRIYPTYWFCLTLVIVAALGFASLRETLPSGFFTYLFTYLLVPQDKTIVGGTGAPVLGVAWTLQYEMFFYLSFALFILSRFAGFLLLGAYLIGFVVVKFQGITGFPMDFIFAEYCFMFLFGAIVGVLYSRAIPVKLPKASFILGILGFALIAAVDVVYRDSSYLDNRMERKLGYSLFSALMIYALVTLEGAGAISVKNRLLLLIGDASYAIYLIHFPIVSAVTKFFYHLFPKTSYFAVGNFLVCSLICIAAGIAIHLFFEKRILAYLNKSPAISADETHKASSGL